jgi:putative addiction module component (TIGR02574 family)
MTAETIEDAALHLPEPQRAQLAHKLLISLNTQDENEIAVAWRDEVQRRAVDLDNGVATLISADAVRAAAKKLLR